MTNLYKNLKSSIEVGLNEMPELDHYKALDISLKLMQIKSTDKLTHQLYLYNLKIERILNELKENNDNQKQNKM